MNHSYNHSLTYSPVMGSVLYLHNPKMGGGKSTHLHLCLGKSSTGALLLPLSGQGLSAYWHTQIKSKSILWTGLPHHMAPSKGLGYAASDKLGWLSYYQCPQLLAVPGYSIATCAKDDWTQILDSLENDLYDLDIPHHKVGLVKSKISIYEKWCASHS